MISVSVSARILSELNKLKQTAGSASMTRNAQFNSLSTAAHYVTTIPESDARLQVLRRVSIAMGGRDGQSLPGPKQLAALQTHPHGFESAPPHKVLDAITMAALEDFIAHSNRAATRASQEAETLRAKVRDLEERPVDRTEILSLQSQRDRWHEASLANKQEIRALREENATLRAAVDGGDKLPEIPESPTYEPTIPPEESTTPDLKAWDSAPKHKQRVPGKPGIYFKVSKAGELYGFGATVPDAAGGQQDAKQTFASVPAAEDWRSAAIRGPAQQAASEPAKPPAAAVSLRFSRWCSDDRARVRPLPR